MQPMRTRRWSRVARAAALATTLAFLQAPLSSVAPAAASSSDCTGLVALTFDDGPLPGPTNRLLAILSRTEVPATFFVVGSRVDTYPALVRDIAARGHVLANHTYGHDRLTRLSDDSIRASLRRTDAALRRAGVPSTGLMRPPYGAIDGRVRRVITGGGRLPVLWNVDSEDWSGGSGPQIARRVLDRIRPGRGNIVLMHDGVRNSPASVAAVPIIIERARARGYCFVPLDGRGRPGFHTPRVRVETGVSPHRRNGTVDEGRTARIRLRLDRPVARATSVLVRLRSGTARVGTDLPKLRRRVVIAPGATVREVRVPIAEDQVDEQTERFSVTLHRPRGLLIDGRHARVRVRDRTPTPRLIGGRREVVEPAEGERTVRVWFSLRRSVSSRPVRFRAVTASGTAGADDYREQRHRVVIPPGRRSVVVPVVVLADDEIETAEWFALRVSEVRNAIAGSAARITVLPTEASEPEPDPGTG